MIDRVKERIASSSTRVQVVVFWLPMAAWMATIFLLSSLPSDTIERIARPVGFDSLVSEAAHFTIYAVLAVLVYWLLQWFRPTAAMLWAGVLVVTIGYGLSDELHQSFVRGRFATWEDVGFDALGAAVGLAIAALAARWAR